MYNNSVYFYLGVEPKLLEPKIQSPSRNLIHTEGPAQWVRELQGRPLDSQLHLLCLSNQKERAANAVESSFLHSVISCQCLPKLVLGGRQLTRDSCDYNCQETVTKLIREPKQINDEHNIVNHYAFNLYCLIYWKTFFTLYWSIIWRKKKKS